MDGRFKALLRNEQASRHYNHRLDSKIGSYALIFHTQAAENECDTFNFQGAGWILKDQ